MEVKIDDAIAAKLKRAAATEHISFDEAVGLALKVGTDVRFGMMPGKVAESKPYKLKTHSFGNPMTNLKALIAQTQEEEDLDRYHRGGG